MNDEHAPVRLEMASRHSLPYRWSAPHAGNLSNVDSAITYLKTREDLQTTEHVFRIVNSLGTVVMDDTEISDKLRKR